MNNASSNTSDRETRTAGDIVKKTSKSIAEFLDQWGSAIIALGVVFLMNKNYSKEQVLSLVIGGGLVGVVMIFSQITSEDGLNLAKEYESRYSSLQWWGVMIMLVSTLFFIPFAMICINNSTTEKPEGSSFTMSSTIAMFFGIISGAYGFFCVYSIYKKRQAGSGDDSRIYQPYHNYIGGLLISVSFIATIITKYEYIDLQFWKSF